MGRDTGEPAADAAGSVISIHAPLVGRDLQVYYNRYGSIISIHAPLVGRDVDLALCFTTLMRFQSTRPLWGATKLCLEHWVRHDNFNPRAPCGARRVADLLLQRLNADFNPRAPCGARQSSPNK